MTEAQIAHIEASLGPLPAQYRRFLLDSDDWSYFPCEAYGVERMIRENYRLRRWPDEYQVIQPDGTSVPWPAGWLAVSDNGGGDHWFVRDDDDGQSVWFWDHESWEAHEVATTIGEFLSEVRESREANRLPTAIVDHPTLGPVEFSGSSYFVNGPLAVFVQVGWLHADPAAQRAVLDAAARLIHEAVAEERRVLDAALPQLVELQHEPVPWLPDFPKLTAEQIRERLTEPNLNVYAERSGDGFELKLCYVYTVSGSFPWDHLLIECGPDRSVRNVSPL